MQDLDLYEAKHYRLSFDEYWAALHECGWLGDVPEHKHADLQDRLRLAFSHKGERWAPLTDAGLDARYMCDIGDYEREIALFAETSGGLFNATEIREEYNQERQRLLISFQHGGARFECEAQPPISGYFDEAIMVLINQALEVSNISNRFITLPRHTSHVWLFALVSERAYHCAEKHGLIPPPEYYWYKEFKPNEINTYLSEYYIGLDETGKPIC